MISVRSSLSVGVASQYILQLEAYDSGEPLRRDVTNITVDIIRSPPCLQRRVDNFCGDWTDTVTIPEDQLGGVSFYTVCVSYYMYIIL